jgi:hypothetical protein
MREKVCVSLKLRQGGEAPTQKYSRPPAPFRDTILWSICASLAEMMGSSTLDVVAEEYISRG